MATVTNGITGGTTSTANTTSYASASFTPVAGDLLVVGVGASGTVATGTTLTASANSLTFTLVLSAVSNASVDTQYVYVSDQLIPASPAAMTVTFDCSADAATGSIISVARVSGLTRSGTSAIKQSAKVENVAGGTAPATTFGASCLTGNPTLFFIQTNVATGATPPTGWTEQVDATYSTPTKGGGYDSRDSGFTGTTITLGSTTNGACDAIAVELDTSASGVSGDVSIPLTDTITSGAVVGKVAAVAVALTCAITATAVVGTSSGSTVNETATIASAATVGVSSGASVPLTATITSTASVTSGLTGSVSVPLTDTIASQAVVGVSSGASLAETATVTSAAVVGKATGATVTETATITSAAQVGKVAGASVTPAFVLTADGQVGKVATSTVGLTFAVTATASVHGGGPAVPYVELTAPARLATLTAPARPSVTAPARSATLTAPEAHRTLTAPGATRTLTAPEVE